MVKEFNVNPEYPIDEMEYKERPVPPFHHRSNTNRKKWLLIGGAVTVVLIAAGAIYWFVLRTPAAKPKPVTVTSEEQQPSTPAGPTNFKSDTLGVEVTYKDGWKLKESADKNELVLTSPKTTYQRVDGTSTQGVFTIKLRHGVLPDAMGPTVQKSIAARDSEVIAYAQPTPAQRQYTNVTYAGADANSFSFFIVSGNASLKAGQTIGYNIDLIGTVYLIAGGYGTDANDALAFDPVAKGAMDNDTFRQAMDIVKSLKIY